MVNENLKLPMMLAMFSNTMLAVRCFLMRI